MDIDWEPFLLSLFVQLDEGLKVHLREYEVGCGYFGLWLKMATTGYYDINFKQSTRNQVTELVGKH
jgi:hypothetical protein